MVQWFSILLLDVYNPSVKVYGKVPSDMKVAISFETIFRTILFTKFVTECRNCKHVCQSSSACNTFSVLH